MCNINIYKSSLVSQNKYFNQTDNAKFFIVKYDKFFYPLYYNMLYAII